MLLENSGLGVLCLVFAVCVVGIDVTACSHQALLGSRSFTNPVPSKLVLERSVRSMGLRVYLGDPGTKACCCQSIVLK